MCKDWLSLDSFAVMSHLRSSPNKHATKHFHATGHPIIEGYDPPEGWGYVDQQFIDLGGRTPHNGPIPQFV
jgi:hypothetical protein